MPTPFIRNHQFNAIRRQSELLIQALRTVADRNVLKAVRDNAAYKLDELFPELPDERRRELAALSELDTAEQFQQYLEGLEPWREAFPPMSNNQLRKLFPKTKKLNAPDMALLDFRRLTYLGWTDIAANRMYLVYPSDGRYIGIAGRFTAVNKKGYCLICNGYEEIALFTVKTRPANSPPDYYKAFGNYICLDSQACNRRIADTAALEQFIQTIREGKAADA
ncbi:FusB/FusC family EF-G-binding protein [Paenibacillus sp. MWE-103]|uniref:FusB/FusC family EF-G-binding protein n=1 Tax=Paenibacillus artemisiicola TaxID=1172618 RepID=A0ABS3W2X5_9BACL|nr:FusB/FusC family EF-G-binding protein [Paenibacillus artemisiicola]MBO7742656.1 FusB/FusC family EF-G-binding protein [Paenibacillus artemisiicola]